MFQSKDDEFVPVSKAWYKRYGAVKCLACREPIPLSSWPLRIDEGYMHRNPKCYQIYVDRAHSIR